tara:strand:+ start:2125 stop:2502 length:378 start_codon:yes stop_codon:yes gene_type:complete
MLQNLGSKSYQLAVRPTALSASTGVGSAIDLNDYEGDIVFSLDASAGGASITYAVKITESDTSGGAYTDVSGGGFTTSAANTAVQEKIYVNSNDMKRYIKASVTVAGGTGTGYVSVVALAAKKYD